MLSFTRLMRRWEQMALSLPMDGTLRFELFLPVWAACALLYRMYTVLNPDFEYPIFTSSWIYTSVADINVVVIWVLLGLMFITSVRRMSAVVFELGVFEDFMWTMAKNLLTVSPIFLLYDFWLIYFVYATWTYKFALFVQVLQAFPSAMLVCHSVYQHCFIVMARRKMCSNGRRVNIGCVAVVNAGVNLIMLLHLVCTTVVLYQKHPSEVFDAFWIMLVELVFRIVGLVVFIHMYIYRQPKHPETVIFETEYEYNNPGTEYRYDSETILVFTPPSYSLIKNQAQYAPSLEDHSQSPLSLEDYNYEVIPEQVCDTDDRTSKLILGNVHAFFERATSLSKAEYV